MTRQYFARTAMPMAFVLALVLGLSACGQQPGETTGEGGGERPPAPVTYVSAQAEDVTIDADYAGRLYGFRAAEVRARVGGILEQRLYEEGEYVEERAPLFRIDQRPFRIALQRAEAEKADARAALNQAEREWRRVSGLFEKNAVSERERDKALSAWELAQARFALAEAGVAQAQLDLEYSVVSAPVSGVSGIEALTAGNLVAAGDFLTTVTQLDPIQVRFSMPAEDAAARRGLQAGAAAERQEVVLMLRPGQPYAHRGRVDFSASTVDPDTGNVQLRALFPNPEQELKPGALVRLRLAINQLESVHLLEPQAVSEGMAGPMVFIVGEDNTVRAQDVRLGPMSSGRQLILQGIEDGDRVVVKGQVSLRDGARVDPEPLDSRGE